MTAFLCAFYIAVERLHTVRFSADRESTHHLVFPLRPCTEDVRWVSMWTAFYEHLCRSLFKAGPQLSQRVPLTLEGMCQDVQDLPHVVSLKTDGMFSESYLR